jgi:protein-ribulosamine 3-kinase
MNTTDSSIARALGSSLVASRCVGGGCIHDARCIDLADGRRVFVKSGQGKAVRLLEAEENGLRLIAPHIRTPGIVGAGSTADGTRWLALEWLDLHPMRPNSWDDLGRQLATLHAVTAATHGLDHDNFIGATPQNNRPLDSWHDFYLERRLRPQLELAGKRHPHLSEPDILGAAEILLERHNPAPSLLHGDLWSGNTAALSGGHAVVFDPAPSFGDPETDLAMLELFGGPLTDDFLRSYGPLACGRELRRPLYDLYHALNHLNLFGSGYLGMVERCLTAICPNREPNRNRFTI